MRACVGEWGERVMRSILTDWNVTVVLVTPAVPPGVLWRRRRTNRFDDELHSDLLRDAFEFSLMRSSWLPGSETQGVAVYDGETFRCFDDLVWSFELCVGWSLRPLSLFINVWFDIQFFSLLVFLCGLMSILFYFSLLFFYLFNLGFLPPTYCSIYGSIYLWQYLYQLMAVFISSNLLWKASPSVPKQTLCVLAQLETGEFFTET